MVRVPEYLEDEVTDLEESIAEMTLSDDFRDVHFLYDRCQIKLSLLYQETLKILLGGDTV